MIIPDNVQKKIIACCYHSYNTEWSGTLFYTIEGSFEENNLVVIVKDFLVLDIGTQAHTEFETSPETSHYMVMNNLLGCYQGLIHSHNTMSAFFSGEDTNTLNDLGNDMAHFVSLIVNNEGTYCARITRKVVAKRTGISEVSYATFNNQEVQAKQDFSENMSMIQWFKLDIEIQSESPIMEEVKKRFEELKKTSSAKIATPSPYYNSPYYQNGYSGGGYPQINSGNPVSKNTGGNKDNKNKKNKGGNNKPVIENTLFKNFVYNPNYTEEELNAAVCKMLIASLMAPANAVKNLENWVATQMEKKFDTIFGESKKEDFEAWALGHILCIIECFLLKGKVNDANVSEAASDIYDVLTEFKSNPYLESYKDILLTEFILTE